MRMSVNWLSTSCPTHASAMDGTGDCAVDSVRMARHSARRPIGNHVMRLLPFLLLLLGLTLPGVAHADVEIGFYSREMTVDLPHAFVTVNGEADGKRIDTSYGFTAKSVTPAILWGAVPGRIDITEAAYIAKSQRHFTVTVPASAWPRIAAIVARYASPPGNVYRIGSRNCVHFVGEIAQAMGMKVSFDKHAKRPRAFLDGVGAANRGFPTMRADR